MTAKCDNGRDETGMPLKSEKSTSSKSKTAGSSRSFEDPVAQTLREAIVRKLDAWVASVPKPDEPLVGSASGKSKPLSPRDIARHVKRRTPTGEKLVQNWVDLVVKHIKGAPLI